MKVLESKNTHCVLESENTHCVLESENTHCEVHGSVGLTVGKNLLGNWNPVENLAKCLNYFWRIENARALENPF